MRERWLRAEKDDMAICIYTRNTGERKALRL
jgi:hypothetical protein